MKKIITVVICCLMMCSVAEARWHGGPGGHFHRHHRGWGHGYNIAAGIIGTTAGVLLAEELINTRKPRVVERIVEAKPQVYMVEPEGKCYTIVSRKTGKVRQECVENSSDDIIYVD